MDKIEKLTQENKELRALVDILKQENSLQKDIVLRQSKMASMGEMIANIAHQWRQPLMEVSSILINMEAQIKLTGKISHNDILKSIDRSNDILKHMSQTIDDFRNFFATNKSKEMFVVAKCVQKAINMIRASITKNNIKVNIIIKNNIKMYGSKNEYLQVLINIISNSIDAIVYNKSEKKIITIKIFRKSKFLFLEIEDSAGGIDTKPIEKVFEPFYTKDKKNGTGIGLFMSKLIIENNFNGKLCVENKPDGACFRIITQQQ